MGGHETITTERRGHVLLIGLNRPAKRNAFNLQMIREVASALAAYEADDALRCAVIFGHGDHFTAGLDLAEVGPAVAGGEDLFPRGAVDIVDLTEPRRTKPLIVTVHGWCLTVGVEMMLAADIRLAARDSRLAQMEVRRGIMPFGGATLRFPQVAGWGNAMRYLLTGDEFGAEEALRIGLVQEVVEPGRHLERAAELAERVARQAPLAVRATLRASRRALEQGREPALEPLMDEARDLMSTRDAYEGMMSFVERREARFTGK